jgi:DtxR family Mn-dependent transcriptional regulator
VRRIAEPVQENSELMTALRRAGVQPGEIVSVTRSEGGVMVGSAGEYVELDDETAAHIFVAAGAS